MIKTKVTIMFDFTLFILLPGMVFDYLSLVIAILTVVQIIWGLFAKA
jgi:hypothetical protein